MQLYLDINHITINHFSCRCFHLFHLIAHNHGKEFLNIPQHKQQDIRYFQSSHLNKTLFSSIQGFQIKANCLSNILLQLKVYSPQCNSHYPYKDNRFLILDLMNKIPIHIDCTSLLLILLLLNILKNQQWNKLHIISNYLFLSRKWLNLQVQ